MTTMKSVLLQRAEAVVASELGGSPLTTAEHNKLRVELTKRWYKTLDPKQLYEDPRYLWRLIACYRDWSHSSVLFLLKSIPEKKINSVLDLHAGIGLASLEIKSSWPHAGVIAHIVPKLHRKIARSLSTELGLTIGLQHRIPSRNPVDLLIGFECFEHIRDPIAFAREVFDEVNPRWYADMSSFTVESDGHWPSFEHAGGELDGRQMKRTFNTWLKARGYSVHAKGWNARPVIWRRG